MDARAQQARDHHRQAGTTTRVAKLHRTQRDQLVRALWASDRKRWTYRTLATAVGCSPELIAKIISGRTS